MLRRDLISIKRVISLYLIDLTDIQNPVACLRTPTCRSALASDLARSGSKTCACGVSGTTESSDFAAAARQIAGQATLRAAGGSRTTKGAESRSGGMPLLLILAGGRGSKLARDLPGTGSKSGACGVSGLEAAHLMEGRQLLRLRQNRRCDTT